MSDPAADALAKLGLSADDLDPAAVDIVRRHVGQSPVEAAMAEREQAAAERQRREKARLDAQATEVERRQAAWDALSERERIARTLAGDTAMDAQEGDGR